MRVISSAAELAPVDRMDGDAGMAIDRLLPVARLALDRAGLAVADIDLIVTLSLSPDRLAVDPAIVGPRIGHPMQRALGAERAYLFDLMDCSLAKALHVIDVFGWAQAYRRVLVLRSEMGTGLDQSECGSLRIVDGAAALVVVPDGRSRLASAPIAGVAPLVFALNPHIRHPLDIKACLHFTPPVDFLPRHGQAVEAALERVGVGVARHVVESWFLENGGTSCAGPFTLPLALSHFLAEGDSGSLVAVSFDPFAPGIDAASIEFGGGQDA